MTHATAAVGPALRFAASRLIILGLASVSSIIVARTLPVADFGTYAASSGLVILLFAFGHGGIDQLFLANAYDSAALRALLNRLASMMLVISAFCSFALPGLNWSTRVCFLLLATAASVELARSWWLLVPQRTGIFGLRARRELATKLALIVVVSIVAIVSHSVFWVVSASTLVSVGITLYCNFLASAPASRRRITSLEYIRALRDGLPYALSGALYLAYFSVDIALLGVLGTLVDTARYRVALSLVSIAVVIPVAMNNDVYRPRLYVMRARCPEVFPDKEAKGLIRRFGYLAVFLGVGAGATTVALGHYALTTLFGAQYEAARPLAVVLGLAIPFHYVNSWAGNTLMATGKTGQVLTTQVVLAIANLAANVVAIPRWGAMGAAGCTVGTELLGCAMYCILLLGRSLVAARTKGDARK